MVSVAEEWRAVPEFEGMYEVSNHGRVRSLDRTVQSADGRPRFFRGRDMKTHSHFAGYRLITLCRHGKYINTTVHALVAAAFIGPRPAGMDVNHIDGRKDNNRPENLEYVTRKENMVHARQTDLWDNRGEKNGQATATNAQVRKAFELMQGGMNGKQAAAAVGVSPHVIYAAKDGRHWKSLGLPQLPRRSAFQCVSDDMRANAIEIVRGGGGYADLVGLGISKGTASRLVKYARSKLEEVA